VRPEERGNKKEVSKIKEGEGQIALCSNREQLRHQAWVKSLVSPELLNKERKNANEPKEEKREFRCESPELLLQTSASWVKNRPCSKEGKSFGGSPGGKLRHRRL